jgi:NTE family protein
MEQRKKLTETNALVLAGGGAKGMYQVAAIKQIEKQLDIKFDVIAGISVGAINGAMLATDQFDKCEQMWETITKDDIHKSLSPLKIAFRVLKWKLGLGDPVKSIYDNGPIKRLLKQYLKEAVPSIPFYAGRVDLNSGIYESAIRETMSLDKYVLASASIPGIWDPVQQGDKALVDGGIRNISPIWEVLKHDPDNVFIITTESHNDERAGTSGDIFEIAQSSIGIMLKEIFYEDLERFLQINDLVLQAEEHGHALYHGSGRKLKYYNPVIISPTVSLGSALDYSREQLQFRKEQGKSDTREILNSMLVRRNDGMDN